MLCVSVDKCWKVECKFYMEIAFIQGILLGSMRQIYKWYSQKQGLSDRAKSGQKYKLSKRDKRKNIIELKKHLRKTTNQIWNEEESEDNCPETIDQEKSDWVGKYWSFLYFEFLFLTAKKNFACFK